MSTILIIDDDNAMRELFAEQLRRADHVVIGAETAAEGIEQCRKQLPDLVLCDLRLPDQHGFEVLKTLSSMAPEMPLIVVSVVDELSDAVDAFRHGAWDYISKPVANAAVLEHAVQQALERAELLQKNRTYQENLEASNAQLERSLLKLKEDEEAGRQLQFQLLPPNAAELHGYRFQHRLFTSLYLSGDFVDYFLIDDEHVGFYIADVSGHGVSSAFVTVLLKSYMTRYLELFRQQKSRSILDPAKILQRLNHNILESNTDKYLTMFYGIINKSTQQLYYSTGGHYPYPLLFDGERVQFIECKSKPVGLFDFARYQINTLSLPPQFSLAFVSDGILDALPFESLQEKRQALSSLLHETGLDTDAFTARLDRQIAGSELPDDVTLLLIGQRDSKH